MSSKPGALVYRVRTFLTCRFARTGPRHNADREKPCLQSLKRSILTAVSTSDAIEGLNLQCADSLFAFVGPNGAANHRSNFAESSAADVRTAVVLGVVPRRMAREARAIGYVSKIRTCPDWMTVEQLINTCGRSIRRGRRTVRKLQRDLDLTSRLPIRSFSRGMRMKAALLVSLAYRPELVVLDEPFSGLDPLARDELIRALLELTGEHNWTTLISSHDIDEVERLADTIAFIDNGASYHGVSAGSHREYVALFANCRLLASHR